MQIWNLLKKGGRLLLTIPCAREGFEEYIDYNEYNLLEIDENGFVFGQYIYDEMSLKERIFKNIGCPEDYSIFGEIKPGFIFQNRIEKMDDNYPFYKEPYIVGRNFRLFNEIDELPGLGVIAMEFIKK